MSEPADRDTLPPALRATALGHKAGPPQNPASSVRVDSFGLTDRGKVRPENQDHFLIGRIGRFAESIATSLPTGELPDRIEEGGYVAIVADGMGGHAGGEIASRTAIIVFFHLLFDTPDWVLKVDERSAQKIQERNISRYRSLDSLLAERARIDPSLYGMGTTMTLTYSIGLDLFLAHVGDSRAYLYRDGTLRQLTRDHTRVQRMVDAGLLTREEAATHRLRNVLTNVLGGGAPLSDVDVHRIQLAHGDTMLLCTDGLHGVASDEEIGAILSGASSAEGACRSLVEIAIGRGAPDNVTVAVARYAPA